MAESSSSTRTSTSRSPSEGVHHLGADIEVACGVMCNARGQIFMGLRPAGVVGAGFWEFPGGKREAGESIEECLRREWLEETGFNVDVREEIYAARHGQCICRFFVGDILGAPAVAAADSFAPIAGVHEAVRFVSPLEALALRLFPGDEEVVHRLCLQMQLRVVGGGG